LSMGVVFVKDRLDPIARTPQQMENYLGVPVFAQQPNQEYLPPR